MQKNTGFDLFVGAVTEFVLENFLYVNCKPIFNQIKPAVKNNDSCQSISLTYFGLVIF